MRKAIAALAWVEENSLTVGLALLALLVASLLGHEVATVMNHAAAKFGSLR